LDILGKQAVSEKFLCVGLGDERRGQHIDQEVDLLIRSIDVWKLEGELLDAC